MENSNDKIMQDLQPMAQNYCVEYFNPEKKRPLDALGKLYNTNLEEKFSIQKDACSDSKTKHLTNLLNILNQEIQSELNSMPNNASYQQDALISSNISTLSPDQNKLDTSKTKFFSNPMSNSSSTSKLIESTKSILPDNVIHELYQENNSNRKRTSLSNSTKKSKYSLFRSETGSQRENSLPLENQLKKENKASPKKKSLFENNKVSSPMRNTSPCSGKNLIISNAHKNGLPSNTQFSSKYSNNSHTSILGDKTQQNDSKSLYSPSKRITSPSQKKKMFATPNVAKIKKETEKITNEDISIFKNKLEKLKQYMGIQEPEDEINFMKPKNNYYTPQKSDDKAANHRNVRPELKKTLKNDEPNLQKNFAGLSNKLWTNKFQESGNKIDPEAMRFKMSDAIREFDQMCNKLKQELLRQNVTKENGSYIKINFDSLITNMNNFYVAISSLRLHSNKN